MRSVLGQLGHEVIDTGAQSDEPVDFPDITRDTCDLVRRGEADRAVLVCGTGQGAVMAANKMAGIRCALAHDVYSAHQSVEHDDANAIAMGAWVIGRATAGEVIEAFLDARFDNDDDTIRRVAKLRDIEREDWRNILRVIALRVVESCAYYLTATYLLSYITKREPTDRTIALTGVVVASIIAVGTTLLAGHLTDRVGRRRVYLAGCLLAIAFGIPMYLMANTGELFLIVLLFIIGIGGIHAVLTGTQAAWFAELFNTSTRTSGASIGNQVAASIAGFAPFLAVLLANSFGWIGPAMFYVAVGLVGLAGVVATKETWGPKQRAEVDALIRGEVDAHKVEASPA